MSLEKINQDVCQKGVVINLPVIVTTYELYINLEEIVFIIVDD